MSTLLVCQGSQINESVSTKLWEMMCDKTVLLLKLIILFSLLDVNWSVRNSSFFLVFGERCLHSTKVLCVPQGYSARAQLPGLMVGAEEASHALLLLPYAQRVRAQLGEVCNRVSGLVYSVPHLFVCSQ